MKKIPIFDKDVGKDTTVCWNNKRKKIRGVFKNSKTNLFII